MVSATDSVATFLNAAVNRAERRQQAIELVIQPKEGDLLALYSTEPGFKKQLQLPDGVMIEAVQPADGFRRPAGAAPLPLPSRRHRPGDRDSVREPPRRAPAGASGPDDRLSARGKRRTPVRGTPVKAQRGFTLLEMLVATTIMGLAIAGLMSGLSNSTRNAARLRDYDRVVQLARLRMNDLLADMRAAPQCHPGRSVRARDHRRIDCRLARARDESGEFSFAFARRFYAGPDRTRDLVDGRRTAAQPHSWKATGAASLRPEDVGGETAK